MAITPQERELVIIGVSVASGSKGNLRESVMVAHQLHVPDEAIEDTISNALRIRRTATESMENFVSAGFAEQTESESGADDLQRIQALVSVGAAFAVNCVASLDDEVAKAKVIGIPEEDLDAVVSLTAFMKAMAASHVERFMNPDGVEDESDTMAEYGTPFGPDRCAWAGFCRSKKAQSFAPE
jgi:alkylhydroperoxidase/carboxymuconolactone decarboxylase family protein YurZ